MAATRALARLYAAPRLYINFFQPSFKLKSKRRDGARASKTYYPPRTPYERLRAWPGMKDLAKARLGEEFKQLDPVRLLREIRSAQQAPAHFAAHGAGDPLAASAAPTVEGFQESLATAWRCGEVRPTHRRQPGAHHW